MPKDAKSVTTAATQNVVKQLEFPFAKQFILIEEVNALIKQDIEHQLEAYYHSKAFGDLVSKIIDEHQKYGGMFMAVSPWDGQLTFTHFLANDCFEQAAKRSLTVSE